MIMKLSINATSEREFYKTIALKCAHLKNNAIPAQFATELLSFWVSIQAEFCSRNF